MTARRHAHLSTPDDRSLELAAAHALGVFDEQEERELLEAFGDDATELLREFELAAAALETALPAPLPAERMPDAVRSRLRASAAEWAASAPAARRSPASLSGRGADRLAFEQRTAAPGSPGRARSDWFAWGGWIAAAACLALALGGVWFSRGPASSRNAAGSGFAVEPGAAPERIADARSRLLYWGIAEQGDAVYASWSPLETPDPTARGAAGDVVWSNEHQTGYMRLEGLAPNDPSEFQYQLWIFDEDQKHPIDGGVFDVPSGRTDAVVPIDAKIRVAKPTLFAVTVERPGGVVVSDRERIALIAPEPKPVAECLPKGSVAPPKGRRRAS